METNPYTDRRHLIGKGYRHPDQLSARRLIYQFGERKHDLPTLVLEHIPDEDRLVVDVGCGDGRFICHIRDKRRSQRLVGIDISAAIVQGISAVAPVVLADAEKIPLADSTAACVLAIHMLYHVNDIGAAMREFSRVLTPDGRLIVSTYATNDRQELHDLWSAAVENSPERSIRWASFSSRFAVRDAMEHMDRNFVDVRLIEINETIDIHEAHSVIAHLSAYRPWVQASNQQFENIIGRMRSLLTRIVACEGKFSVTSRLALIVGDRPKRTARNLPPSSKHAEHPSR